MSEVPGIRVRLRFSKLGKVRFTSHRDVARLWERALRREGLPVASTQGFSPRPRLHFGLALPTGHESLGEYLDVDLREPVEVEPLPELLTPLLPPGLDVQAAAVIERSAPSLQEAVVSCSWRIALRGADPAAVRDGIGALLASDAIPVVRERKGRTVSDDLRPAIGQLELLEPSHGSGWRIHEGSPELAVELATQPRGVRPSEFIDALRAFAGPGASGEERVCREHQWIVLDGARQEPLPPGATRAPHAMVRAS